MNIKRTLKIHGEISDKKSNVLFSPPRIKDPRFEFSGPRTIKDPRSKLSCTPRIKDPRSEFSSPSTIKEPRVKFPCTPPRIKDPRAKFPCTPRIKDPILLSGVIFSRRISKEVEKACKKAAKFFGLSKTPGKKSKSKTKAPISQAFRPKKFIRVLQINPASTVTGFKKFTLNSVKVKQNELVPPSIIRRKPKISHMNQTLKEIARFGGIYGFLSITNIKNYSAFALNFSGLFDMRNTNNVLPPDYSLRASGKNTQVGETSVSPLQTDLGCYKKYQKYTQYSKTTPIKSLQTGIHRSLISIFNFLESRRDTILMRNLLSESIPSARHKLRTGLVKFNGVQEQRNSKAPCFIGDVLVLQ